VLGTPSSEDIAHGLDHRVRRRLPLCLVPRVRHALLTSLVQAVSGSGQLCLCIFVRKLALSPTICAQPALSPTILCVTRTFADYLLEFLTYSKERYRNQVVAGHHAHLILLDFPGFQRKGRRIE